MELISPSYEFVNAVYHFLAVYVSRWCVDMYIL